jgi:FkbM family methyltransferase
LFDPTVNQNLITYAQNREDIFLFALLGHIEDGVYVDVGAHDPTFHSVTRMFYERGWRGLNIEANPRLLQKFLDERPFDTNISVGVSNTDGEMTFREYPGALGYSSFHDAIKEIHERTDRPYVDATVPVRTLAAIFEETKPPRIDFLKIDVEGHELEVLRGNDWSRWRPSVVLAEAICGAEITAYLSDVAYKFEFFDGLNNYYVEQDALNVTMDNYPSRILSYGYRVATDQATSEVAPEPVMGVRGTSAQLARATNQWLKTRRR